MSNSTAPALKDHFGPSFIEEWADRLIEVGAEMDREQFVSATLQGYERLTFTQRSWKMAENIRDVVPGEVPDVLKALLSVLPDENETAEGVLNEGFWMWPIGDYIRLYGTGHFDESMEACYELTKRFTAEFAIRPFLDADFERVVPYLQDWVEDSNEHVRRLVSEGTRPRLPWASKLVLPIEPVVALLGALRRDSSAYVRKSVANHLNDLAKDDSDRILTVLEGWHAEGNESSTWIVRHALRNHFKKGNARALALFGYRTPDVAVAALTCEPSPVPVGDTAVFSFNLTSASSEEQSLMIDLVVSYQKANGRTSPKVFKFKDTVLGAKETIQCEKRLSMVHRSTRKLHPGQHRVDIQINGVVLDGVDFELEF